tara:strand:+ start:4223 stop:4732 length:510 start_codon:yes stop_codon:yes gene_type:complete
MKTVTYSVLVLCTSLVAFLSTTRAEKAAGPYTSPMLEQIEGTVDFYISDTTFHISDTTDTNHKKEYHIFFENRSREKIEVAIRYKEYNGEWVTSGFEVLAPKQKKLMGNSDETTYFYYATSQHKSKKKVWQGDHKFALKEGSKKKLGFKRQSIWECYNTDACNEIAVFK